MDPGKQRKALILIAGTGAGEEGVILGGGKSKGPDSWE